MHHADTETINYNDPIRYKPHARERTAAVPNQWRNNVLQRWNPNSPTQPHPVLTTVDSYTLERMERLLSRIALILAIIAVLLVATIGMIFLIGIGIADGFNNLATTLGR